MKFNKTRGQTLFSPLKKISFSTMKLTNSGQLLSFSLIVLLSQSNLFYQVKTMPILDS